ncbi:LytTR family transcriptional regulator DNA-binding domain-containing protein [uncultured Lacinutrix sp.]|uniref:LytTR family transcriptional regulator DNA-binding domain-containing protein n=1 Tax=uncultured Lacinutrix sp. TaxID=574032 RepID=UPI00260E7B2F|nr:LytTR family transcriptional regulator DNA-binding domain-containing protein [uncultured Lacinutrix sp.]
MKLKYPFDSSIKHHLLIALGLALWVFVFLYFTEPFDVNELNGTEKLVYLPGYGLVAALLYIGTLPFQYWIYKKNKNVWTFSSELLFIFFFIITAIVIIRLFYLQFVVDWHPNAHSLFYHIKSIILPAMFTILPIVVICRFGFGKYKQKKLEDQKIEIKGEGNYESLRLLLNDLICLQSSDNYIEIFYLSNNTLKKSLIRNKLSVIAESFPELLRTHRSYIVNPYHFEQWKTEKGKHSLLLSNAIEAPISKTYLEATKVVLNFTTA